jgi:single-stranded-DNA-specific exonuclease
MLDCGLAVTSPCAWATAGAFGLIASGTFLGVERSVCGRRWRAPANDDAAAAAICGRLALPEIIGRLLAQRGISLDEAPGFLAPRLRDLLPDPGHLRDMAPAVERLARAIRDAEPIVVFGDYDVDGATAAALLLRFFAAVGAPASVYVPDRMREGYGPNAPALRRLKEEGAAVVVTVDCGATAHDALAAAGEAGLDVIVVDHHVTEPLLPRVLALINPNRLDETSPHGALAAVGVAFLLVVALNRALRDAGWYAARNEPDLLQWLDLVALGTVCDVVPLTGLNRALVSQGLRVARRAGNPGLRALAAVGNVTSVLDAYHLGFVLGPRVNAGGRVGAADLGARLLSTDDPILAAELAQRLDAYNCERREIEAQTLREAIEQVEAGPQSPALVLAAAEGWHPGVIGIVAARLKERYERPACVVALAGGQEGGFGRGSGRSVPGVALGQAVIAARQAGLLISGGGHAMAAGFTVAAARLEVFREFLAERLGDGIEREPAMPELAIDGALSAAGAVAGLIEHVEALAPFGAANPEPRFAFPGLQVAHVEPVGSGHLRATLADPLGPARLKAIAFRVGDGPLGQFLAASRGRAIHVAGHLRRDDYRGGNAVQLIIDDAAPVAG